jgi:hypothetical protein
MGKDLALQDHDDVIKLLAWEVAKNVIDHHKFVYSKIFEAAPSTFPISIRNAIYNEIQSAIKCRTDQEMKEWIAKSEAHRKEMKRLKRLSKKAEMANGDPVKINEVLQELRK